MIIKDMNDQQFGAIFPVMREFSDQFNKGLLELVGQHMTSTVLPQHLFEACVRAVLVKLAMEITLTQTDFSDIEDTRAKMLEAVGMQFDASCKAYLSDIKAVSN